MNAQFRLRLLTLLLTRGKRRGRVSDAGFSIVAVLMVLLVIILGTNTLASRSFSNRLASTFTGQSQEARDVALAGLVEIIGELNQPANRGMLVSGKSLDDWQDMTDTELQNPCLATAATPTTAEAQAVGENSWRNLVAGDDSRRFILRSVRYSSADRSHWYQSRYESDASSTPANSSSAGNGFKDNRSSLTTASEGFIELSVEGQVRSSDGVVLARARVSKELIVVPKCCDSSFNGTDDAFGNGTADVKGTDQRQCDGGGTAVGSLISETRGDDSGDMSPSGINLYELLEDGTIQLSSGFFCVTATARCNGTSGPAPGSANARNGAVPGNPISTLPPPPAFPVPWGPPAPWSIDLKGNTMWYLRVNQTNTALELCDYSVAKKSGAVTLSGCSEPASPGGQSYCVKDENDIADYHCRFSGIELGGSTRFFIDSTGGKIAFYFDDNPGDIDSGGNAQLIHLKCGSFQPSGCSTNAIAEDFTRLAFYSDNPSSTLSLGGTPDDISIFAYFRQGTVTLNGNATILGTVWANTITGVGTTGIIVPTNVCTSDTIGYCSIAGALGGGGGAPSTHDWVARSRSRVKMF